MKVIIDISEKMYEDCKTRNTEHYSMYNFSNMVTNGTPISDNSTNGDMIRALFPNYEETRMCGDVRYGSKEYYNLEFVVDEDWWNAPYKKEVEE